MLFVGNVKHLIWEIKTVVEDCKNNIPGAFVTALRIWEGSVVPYLYYGAECWLDIPQATIKTLCQLEELFYLSVLASPKSTPKPGIYWQVGGKIPEARLMESKLNLYFQLVNLSNQSLAKLILIEEQKMETEGFFREIMSFMARLDIDEDLANTYSKKQWKAMVSQKIVEFTRNTILERAKPYKNCSTPNPYPSPIQLVGVSIIIVRSTTNSTSTTTLSTR